MRCPVCQTVELAIADRQGIEVDYCPSCRGVWLDRGELDKLIERAALSGPRPPADRPAPVVHRDDEDGRWKVHDPTRRDGDEGKHRSRRKSLLGEIFDWD